MSNPTNINTNVIERNNGELHDLPGFFFYPADSTGLTALTFNERLLLLSTQRNYMTKPHPTPASEGERVDFNCLLDNFRIPTHRARRADIPEYGKAPSDLTRTKRIRAYPQRSAVDPLSPFVVLDEAENSRVDTILEKLYVGEIDKGNYKTTPNGRWMFFQDKHLKDKNQTHIFEVAEGGGYVYHTTVQAIRFTTTPVSGEQFAIIIDQGTEIINYLRVYVFDKDKNRWIAEFSAWLVTGILKKGFFFATGDDVPYGLIEGDLVIQTHFEWDQNSFSILRRKGDGRKENAWLFQPKPFKKEKVKAIVDKLMVDETTQQC